MALKPRTKKQLDNLAPESRMLEHAQKLHLPEYVIIELWEQKNFMSKSKLLAMCNWSYEQFYNWYDSTI